MEEDKLKLFSYWRSSCSWRVRLALAIKGLSYDYHAINLLQGEQKTTEYLQLNPSGVVPALSIHDNSNGVVIIGQSVAIMEYLEEAYPEPPLLPQTSDYAERARVRQLVQIIACDTQPLQNMPLLRYLEEHINTTAKQDWAQRAIRSGLQAFDKLYVEDNEIGMPEIVVTPQIYNAIR